MSIICKNKGTEHRHQSVMESKVCWGIIHPTPAPVAPPPPRVMRDWRNDPVSQPQIEKVRRLGGDPTYAAKLTKGRCSDYIQKLIDEPAPAPVPVVVPQPIQRYEDPRLPMVKTMLASVPDGYYATAPDGEGGHVDYLRIKLRNSGKMKGARVIQTQHSDAWTVKMVLWPSGKWSVYDSSTIEKILLVIADSQTCARRYSIEKQTCCVCNKKLTDDKSRHYLIGPICDKTPYGQTVIENVDLANNGLSFEQLVARGLPIVEWQKKAL